MNWEEVQSSNVRRMAYNDDFQEMYVQFHSDRTYQYDNVPRFIYEQIRDSESVGKSLRALVTSAPATYPYREITGEV